MFENIAVWAKNIFGLLLDICSISWTLWPL